MNPNERYYKDSGAVPFTGSLLATVLGLVAAIVLGGVYGIVSKFNPYIILQIVALGIAAAGVGFAVNFAILAGKVRNTIFTTIVAVVAGVTTVYAEWVGFFWAFFEFGALPLDPEELQAGIWLLANIGAVTVFGWQPGATALYVIWGLEALSIVGIVYALAASRDLPFCEECGEWAEESEDCATFVLTDHAKLRMDLECERYEVLEELSEWAGNEINPQHCLRATVYQCPCEGEENYLTIKEVVITIDSDGDENRNETVVVGRIWVPDHVVESLLTPRAPVDGPDELVPAHAVAEEDEGESLADLDDVFERD